MRFLEHLPTRLRSLCVDAFALLHFLVFTLGLSWTLNQGVGCGALESNERLKKPKKTGSNDSSRDKPVSAQTTTSTNKVSQRRNSFPEDSIYFLKDDSSHVAVTPKLPFTFAGFSLEEPTLAPIWLPHWPA